MSTCSNPRSIADSKTREPLRLGTSAVRAGFPSLFVSYALATLFFLMSFSAVLTVTSRGYTQTSSSTKFDSIRFVILTGGDDLRGDSSATAELFSVNGQPLQTLTLKAQNAGGWSNDSTHTVNAKLSQPLSGDEIRRVAITLTSHNGIFETNDNWNINQVSIQLYDANNTYQLATVSGNPYVRLTGSQPTKSIPVS